MPITINGSTGIAGVDGSASTPAIQGTDTNTGVTFPAADTVAVSTGGTERMRVDSSGNVGFGTSSPVSTGGFTNVTAFAASGSQFNATSTNVRGDLLASEGNLEVVVRAFSNHPLTFRTNNTEYARITSTGLFGINAVPDGNARLAVIENSNASRRAADFYLNVASSTATPAARFIKYDNNTTTSNKFVEFVINQNINGSGQINANGASQAAFGSFSDARLKENITDLEPQLEKLVSLRPVEFDYKDGSGHQVGFIAQEFQTVYPDAIGEDNGFLTLTGYGKTEARLIKAIQELNAKVEGLQAEINALKGAA